MIRWLEDLSHWQAWCQRGWWGSLCLSLPGWGSQVWTTASVGSVSTGPQVGRGTPARGFGCLACAGRCWHHHKHPTQWPSQWLKVGLGLSQVPEASRFPPWSVCAFQSCEGKTERMCGGRLAECLAHNKLNKCQLHLVRGSWPWRHYLLLLLILELYTHCLWDCRVWKSSYAHLPDYVPTGHTRFYIRLPSLPSSVTSLPGSISLGLGVNAGWCCSGLARSVCRCAPVSQWFVWMGTGWGVRVCSDVCMRLCFCAWVYPCVAASAEAAVTKFHRLNGLNSRH